MPTEEQQAPIPAVAELLLERERQALRWNAIGRACIAALSVPLGVAVSGSLAERLALSGLFIVMGAAQLPLLRELRRTPNPARIGVVAVALDVALLCALPLIWHLVYTTEDEPLVHLSRHNLTAASVVFLAVNLLALRPLYPLVITAASVALHVLLAALALTDPRNELYVGGLDAAMGVGLSETDMLLVTPLLLAIAGVMAALATRAARETIFEATHLERAHRELQARQLQAVLEGRMAAVGDLVAGVAHEVNNPLATLRSATDTATRCSRRIRELGNGSSAEAERLQRAITALEQSLELTDQAGHRLSEVMATIKGFVQLDAAEVQHLELAEVLRNVLQLVQPVLRSDTRLVSELEEGLSVMADGRQLAQAMTTLLQNAAEAFDGPGELRVTLSRQGSQAQITVSDSGRGMHAEEVARLFDIDFASGTRVRARFGLPLCRSILHRHGGDISVDSQKGHGTKITLWLPLSQGGAVASAAPTE